MIGVNSSAVDFSGANLTNAIITREQLSIAANLTHVVMPNGVFHS